MIVGRLVRWQVGPGAEEEGSGESRKGAEGMVVGRDMVVDLSRGAWVILGLRSGTLMKCCLLHETG